MRKTRKVARSIRRGVKVRATIRENSFAAIAAADDDDARDYKPRCRSNARRRCRKWPILVVRLAVVVTVVAFVAVVVAHIGGGKTERREGGSLIAGARRLLIEARRLAAENVVRPKCTRTHSN